MMVELIFPKKERHLFIKPSLCTKGLRILHRCFASHICYTKLFLLLWIKLQRSLCFVLKSQTANSRGIIIYLNRKPQNHQNWALPSKWDSELQPFQMILVSSGDGTQRCVLHSCSLAYNRISLKGLDWTLGRSCIIFMEEVNHLLRTVWRNGVYGCWFNWQQLTEKLRRR